MEKGPGTPGPWLARRLHQRLGLHEHKLCRKTGERRLFEVAERIEAEKLSATPVNRWMELFAAC